jgi:uncharacterized pyridoxamine 5'-phosphate oxidase family protein
MVTVDEILSHFKPLNYVVLATVEDNKPKLRPVTIIRNNGSFYFATGADSNKVKQLNTNPSIEFILQLKDNHNNGYIRIEGLANKEKTCETIIELYNKFEYLNKLWKAPDDPTLVVYKLDP